MIYLTNLNSFVEGIKNKNYIEDCLFENNKLAIYMQIYGNTSIIRSNFSNNFASYGGAIYLFTSEENSLLEIADCGFIENNSTNYGGAIYIEIYGNTSIIRSNFSKNFAFSNGGAIYLLHQSIFFNHTILIFLNYFSPQFSHSFFFFFFYLDALFPAGV